jgi:2-polyprenyl-3-methyl-5-hydroxy-6-metoxy-1,4-benzoquinol methylase
MSAIDPKAAKANRHAAKSVQSRTRTWLVDEWDRIAPYREDLISSGRDISYRYILSPSIARLLDGRLVTGRRVLDAGCGTGTFIAALAREHPAVDFVGIDPSATSIDIAKTRRENLANCEFRVMSVEDLAHEEPARLGGYDAVIANMLLQNVADFSAVLQACSALLNRDGIFVFAIPHPCFWPNYWGYNDEQWFSYEKESWIEAPFQTSLGSNSTLRTTHVHRPLSAYVNGLNAAQLSIDRLTEPMPSDTVEGVYPAAWEFPRFLIGRALPTNWK